MEEEVENLISENTNKLEIERVNDSFKVSLLTNKNRQELNLNNIENVFSRFDNLENVLKKTKIYIKKDNCAKYNKTLEIVDKNNITWFKIYGNSIKQLLELTNNFLNTLD